MVGTGRFELPTPRTPSECPPATTGSPTQGGFDRVDWRSSPLADRRVLDDQAAMQEIMIRLGLPGDTSVGMGPTLLDARIRIWSGPQDDED